jgi:hypothetical protein
VLHSFLRCDTVHLSSGGFNCSHQPAARYYQISICTFQSRCLTDVVSSHHAYDLITCIPGRVRVERDVPSRVEMVGGLQWHADTILKSSRLRRQTLGHYCNSYSTRCTLISPYSKNATRPHLGLCTFNVLYRVLSVTLPCLPH